MDFKIRSEEERDIEQVRAILCAAFPTEAESKLVDLLRTNHKAIISLVVVASDDQVLGHILFSPVATTPPSDAKGIGLAPVAVRVDAQSLGIGSRLIQVGLQISKELGYNYCVVLGNPAYYERFGFQKASHFGLENEYGVDDEFMVIRLAENQISEGHGPLTLVRYATEFALFSV